MSRLRSADEAVAFLETMRSIYQYAGISEADSKKGRYDRKAAE